MWALVEDALGPDAGKWLAVVSAVTAVVARLFWMWRRG